LESFFVDCCRLVHDVLRALALALRLPRETFLSDTHAAELFQLRLLHYPPVPVSVLRDGSKARIEAHSDFGTLTLLFQDAVGGLQIEDPHRPGVFQNVPPRPGSVLVNVGDLMERWSNGRWRSTVHRVVAPPVAVEGEGRELEGGGSICEARRSIPFFATADPETVIEALPGCWGEENPKKFESVTAWEYVQMRMAALYA
jgi:isopenicillin N synthase-like dioxygenase